MKPKTYKPLVIWFIVFVAVMCIMPALLAFRIPDAHLTLVTITCVYLGLLALFLIIHAGGYVYWINGGPTYEQARDAGEQARHLYSLEHLCRFALAGILWMIYMPFSIINDWTAWIDIIAFGVIILGAARSTMHIKFAQSKEEQA